MRKRTITQTLTGTWAGDSPGIATDIDRTGYITRISAVAEVVPSATLAGANQPDGAWRIVQNLRIVGGEHTYMNLPADDAAMGGTLLHYMNLLDGFGTGHSILTIVAPNRTYTPITFTLHPGSRPRDLYGRDNKFDLTAFIPALREGQLRAEWVTSGNDVMDDTVTITSAVMRYTLHMVQGSPGEIREEMARQQVVLPPGVPNGMVPAWTGEVFNHTAAAADYSVERDIPPGGFLKRICIAEQDTTATRSLRAADEVTGIAVKLAEDGTDIFKAYTDFLTGNMPPGSSFLEAADAALDGGVHNAMGLYFVDLRPHAKSNHDYGLDLRGQKTGAVKLGLTITAYAAGDDSLILYERYLPNKMAEL